MISFAQREQGEIPPGWFITTHWSVILTASHRHSAETSDALEQLCRTYWPPLYAFLRRQGHAPQDAEDIIQGFFERFLAKDYLSGVNPDKGRFRSFLLACLRHYAANVRRDAHTERRGGSKIHLNLDEPAVAARCEAALQSEQRPEIIFDRVWAETIMDAAARRLRDEYTISRRQELYEIIRVWLASEPQSGDYAAAARVLGLSEGTISVAVHRMRRQFRQLVRAEVEHTIQLPAEVDDEMRYLLEVLTTA